MTDVEGVLPVGVHLYPLTRDRAVDLWEQLKVYDALWPDDTRGDVVRWVEFALLPTTLFIAGDDGKSMYILSGIREGLKANIHAVFHDHKLSPRVGLMRGLLAWAMFEFDLCKLEARIPDFSRALRRYLQRDLHFKVDGVLRDDFWYHGGLRSTVVLSLLRDEVG